ncbi:MAG: holo-ACP synthase [Bacteroidetes bacterium]|nr:holo-ACP synthase [Bacteroidota bacterium]
MIFGIGTDLIEVDRIAEKIRNSSDFIGLVFSEKEKAYCESKYNKYEHYAARFAAKEAFLKALGTGWISGTAFNEIEVTNNEIGKPTISFIGTTALTITDMKLGNIQVSLSHLKTLASAIVIIETK